METSQAHGGIGDMDETCGWSGKILRVDLSTGETWTVETMAYAPRFVGGVGIDCRRGLWAGVAHTPQLAVRKSAPAKPATTKTRNRLAGRMVWRVLSCSLASTSYPVRNSFLYPLQSFVTDLPCYLAWSLHP